MGYWGAVTSDYDFCEENYILTHYVAEFFCCFSSIPIIIYGCYFLSNSIKEKLDWKIKLSSIGVAIIGIGSFIFHGTLTRGGQMLDELPMLWSSLFFLFTAVTIEEKPDSMAIVYWGLILTLFGVFNTIVYFHGGFIYFIVSYILTVASVIFTTLRHIYRVSSFPVMTKFAWIAVILYAGGFLVFWIPEQIFCGNRLLPVEIRLVTSLNDLSVPLHAWFHLTSALGPYYWLAFAAYGHVVAHQPQPPDVLYPRCFYSLGLALPVIKPILNKNE